MKPMVRPLLQMHGHDRLRDPVGDRRHAQHADPAPCGLGISTALTGGGKYDPELIRFQIL